MQAVNAQVVGKLNPKSSPLGDSTSCDYFALMNSLYMSFISASLSMDEVDGASLLPLEHSTAQKHVAGAANGGSRQSKRFSLSQGLG